MRAATRSVLLAAMCGVLVPSTAWAIPITWQASGVIDQFNSGAPPYPILEGIGLGTEWTLELTFDTDAIGTLLHPGINPTFVYTDAVDATFRLGGYEYTNSDGDIFVNADLPIVGSSTPLGGPGLVQFQFLRGWLGGGGGPDLNAGLGLFLASYNDPNAINGGLPTIPNQYHPPGAQLGGLTWGSSVGTGNYSHFGSTSFNPVPVPEPTSLLLFGTGLTLAVWRARRKRG